MTDREQLVVVGIDGSAESLAALRCALKEANALDARVEVVHSYLPETLTDLGFSSPHELHAASAIMLENEVKAALLEMPQQPQVERLSLRGGPATVLLERSKNASLLVLGVHGRTALRDIILGRVAQACLRHATCPVIIVGLDQTVDRHEVAWSGTAAG